MEGEHFVDCIEHGKVPETDGQLGLRVVELIEAATSSMRGKGETVYIQTSGENIVIPFVDLKAQYASIKTRSERRDPGRSGQLPVHAWAARWPHSRRNSPPTARRNIGIGVNTGTSALHLALLAADIGRGDEVITVPFTFVATVSAIYYTGATPVFVDIDPRTFTMDVTAIEAAITERTKAIHPGAPVRPAGGHGSDPGDREDGTAWS